MKRRILTLSIASLLVFSPIVSKSVLSTKFGERLSHEIMAHVKSSSHRDLFNKLISEGIYYQNLFFQGNKNKNRITVDLSENKMEVYGEDDNLLATYQISSGRVTGKKNSYEDNITPKGDFRIIEIRKKIPSKYGPVLFLLDGPWFPDIAIHGTPNFKSGRYSSGCIRLKNENDLKLSQIVGVGTSIHIQN